MTPKEPSGSSSPPSIRAEGDERFRVLVESVKDYAIFMVDAGGHVQTWNAGAELIKGYRQAEIIGKSIDLFYTPEERGHAAHLLGEAATNGRVEDEGWRVRKDGTRFWADVIITALRDRSGKVTGFAKVTRDLTERRRAEEQRRRREEDLTRSEERFRLLVQAVDEYAIFMLEPDGRVATWNAGAQRIKGYEASEILGQHFSRFRSSEDVQAGLCERELATAAEKGSLEEEGWRIRKDGSRFWANVILAAVRDPSGKLLGFAKITRDLTDRRQLEDERVGRARAEEAVRLRDEFLSIASHELKTPLTALQIELHSIGERVPPEDGRMVKRVRRAVRNADRLAALVESLLDVTRIATGKLVLNPEPTELSHLVSQLADAVDATATKAGCTVSFTTTGPMWGMWDRLRVEQVLLNLLSNAFKYGAGRPVAVELSEENGHAVLQIVDSGPGIPEPDLGRIFGRFERAAPMQHYGGLGLGLYVSREIIEAQGGTISARNRESGGAVFVVRLPTGVAVGGSG